MRPATFDDVFKLPLDEKVLLGRSACVLRGFALPFVDEVVAALSDVTRHSPFRQMVTPGGDTMSVAMTNCGSWGWITDRRGYRYSALDPTSGAPWPAMPAVFSRLAQAAAAAAGFHNLHSDGCLINRYSPGTRLSLHQDKDERDFDAPIVSVSLGMTATFLFGGLKRTDRTMRVPLLHGDVAVWGGEDRLKFHGVLTLKDRPHLLLGAQRVNLTFRKVG